MPLYEYQCSACGNRTEAIQKFSDDPLTTCESCGGRLERLLSAPAIQFKGKGWYVTDYAGKGKGEASEKHSKPESDKPEKSAQDSQKAGADSSGSEKSSNKGSGSS